MTSMVRKGYRQKKNVKKSITLCPSPSTFMVWRFPQTNMLILMFASKNSSKTINKYFTAVKATAAAAAEIKMINFELLEQNTWQFSSYCLHVVLYLRDFKLVRHQQATVTYEPCFFFKQQKAPQYALCLIGLWGY